MEFNNANPIKVLLVDDHQMFIDGIKAILSNVLKIKILGDALNGQEAIKVMEKQEFDLVIADIKMPVMDGIELTNYIKTKNPNIKVLIVTSHPDRSIIEEAIKAQADGYILKNTSKKELIEAITQVADWGTYYSNEILNILSEETQETIPVVAPEKDILSTREKEIVKLICREHANTKIAEILEISTLTVETHRKNIYKKTEAKTIVGLIKYAIEHNIA